MLAAIGLILPAVLDIIPVLVPLAAVGLVLLLVGAAITHARRKESSAIVTNLVLIVTNLVLIVLAGAVVWGRFGRTPSPDRRQRLYMRARTARHHRRGRPRPAPPARTRPCQDQDPRWHG